MTNSDLIGLAERRFWAKVEKRGPAECWPWKGYRMSKGYGQFGVATGVIRQSHRVAYQLVKGPIPDGFQIDHLCRNPPCCNPNHLEAVTPRENTKRGVAGAHKRLEQISKTHCPAGHEYSEENTYVSKVGKRHCRSCANERKRRNYAARTRG